MLQRLSLFFIVCTLLVSCKSGTTVTMVPEKTEDTVRSIEPTLYNTYPKWFLESPYPSWFFQPQAQTVAAFNTVKAVKLDAYDRHCSYKKMRTKGFYRCFQHEFLGRLAFDEQDSISFYYIPDTTIDTTNFIMLDSLDHGNNKVLLTALDSLEVNNSKQPIATSAPWNKGYEKAGRIYGIGKYRVNYYNHIKGWFIAESNAIKDVMLKTSALIVTLEREFRDISSEDMEEATLYDFDLLIKNLQIERRWFDEKDGNLCVVVSCGVSDITKWKDGMEEGLSDSVLAKITKPETQKVIEKNNNEPTDRDEVRQKLLQSLSNPISIDDEANIRRYESSNQSDLSDRDKKRMQLKNTLHDRPDSTHME